jgi:hypothetical protein
MVGKPGTVSSVEFIGLIEENGVAETARILGISDRAVYARRARLEEKTDTSLARKKFITGYNHRYSERLAYNIADGDILIASDAHYWPGEITTAHRAFVHLTKKLKPKAVVYNGDILDGASISRHPRIGWEQRPSLSEELEACKERLNEVRAAAPKSSLLLHTLGNHDLRFASRLSNAVPEYASVQGTRFEDHFPHWETAWSVWINDSIVIKHRFKGGIHATHNNALWSGKTMVTGHLHSLKVTPLSDYNGVRWGVDSGTLADTYGPQFSFYTEDAPVNWRSGFVVLSIIEGQLLWPDICSVVDDGVVSFRGELIDVS